MAVWALPISLAATLGIDVSFFSSGYLDVSVHRVPLHTLWIHAWIRKVFLRGFPHSDISGSLGMCPSPKLFAAYHVFHRLSVPRHPPCALLSMTSSFSVGTFFSGPLPFHMPSVAWAGCFRFVFFLRCLEVFLRLLFRSLLGCLFSSI